MFPQLWSGTTVLALVVVIALVWALWVAFPAGGFKRWWRDWSLRGARMLHQPPSQIEPPAVHRVSGKQEADVHAHAQRGGKTPPDMHPRATKRHN